MINLNGRGLSAKARSATTKLELAKDTRFIPLCIITMHRRCCGSTLTLPAILTTTLVGTTMAKTKVYRINILNRYTGAAVQAPVQKSHSLASVVLSTFVSLAGVRRG